MRSPESERETERETELRLLNGALDGDLSPAEFEQFETARRTDGRFAEQYEQLLTMQGVLSGADRFEAPPTLKGRIMDALPARAPAPARATTARPTARPAAIRLRRRSILDLIGDFVVPRPAFALATALIVGLVVGAAAFGLFGQANVDPGTTVGTVGAAPGATQGTAPGSETGVFTLTDGDFVATVTVTGSDTTAGESPVIEIQMVRNGEVVDRRRVDASQDASQDTP